ncbi:leucine--tRNA ligase [Psychroflexus salis]|uniref:Leucine--tRNA ligase n=1 Tax=Psychroflexus salis TaxID=1526574 RepID=A0A916ZQM8_9FLAO|nr:leucine--tRNA ligase [Psychroflexus salis]GGE09342.1 leucine--tRNA ligase [Psychroflexus salis]
MQYNFNAIEAKWQKKWAKQKPFQAKQPAELTEQKPPFYVLDMFPYPSGAGLHVGHPLGYIASDIYARYKRHKGFNVLHPQGYDSFGLPAEQYAIQTGQHPAKTTEVNIKRYREQLDKIGFSFDWSREVRTSNPDYYRWTQWIFIQLFESWYNQETDKAEPISNLIQLFEKHGNIQVNAASDEDVETFSAEVWSAFSDHKKEAILLQYRLTYLAETEVNWCPALGTVLANDEIVNGISERGGHPVVRKKMKQWSMRISAYAERLLQGLENLDWTESLKESQRNWIGKSVGAQLRFKIENFESFIEVFTTRPDTIFGVSFMTLAPEHELVAKITTPEQKEQVEAYIKAASLKSERDRMADVKSITGVFTGAYAEHPFTKEPIPIWIGDYVLAGYGTGAVMAVPCGDQRDYDFAKYFNIPIPNVFKDVDISEKAHADKDHTIIANSDFLNGLNAKEAIAKAIEKLEKISAGTGKTNYRLRDAVFSRQRYWGEPFPVYYVDGLPKMINEKHLPLQLPEINEYLPTEDGAPPLGRADFWAWDTKNNKVVDNKLIDHKTIFPLELNTMPGWAGSSWYMFRYMDAHNNSGIALSEALQYWKNVDLYIGGSEHATGHLLYSRFWTKFLNDLDVLPVEEPFKKLINQGMILGESAFVHRLKDSNTFITADLIEGKETQPIHTDVSLVNFSNELDIEGFKNWRPEFQDAKFITDENGKYIVSREVEKMSKSKYNVVNPDDICEDFGADTLRMYEMFLGPLEQAKPWNTAGITGVHNFLKKLWKLYHNGDKFEVSGQSASKESLKTLHKTIKKVTEDIENFSFNTSVSTFMICVNELTQQKCNSKEILGPLAVLISPYAPHIAEELWEKLGNENGISEANYPVYEEKYLKEDNKTYPISFNGKMRFTLDLSLDLSKDEIENAVMQDERTQKQLEGRTPKKVIVVPGKIVNIVG